MTVRPAQIGVDDQYPDTELGKDDRGVDQGRGFTFAACRAGHQHRMRRPAAWDSSSEERNDR